MREVFKYYLKYCSQAMIHRDALSFEFGNYSVIYYFEINEYSNNDDEDDLFENDFFSYNSVNDIKIIDNLLEMKIHFVSFEIRGYEYLGWRQDEELGRSITNEMYYFSKNLKKFNSNCITENYIFFDNDGDNWGLCDTEPNYCFKIKVSEEFYWNKELAEYILVLFETFAEKIPSFYTNFFNEKASIKDDKNINILSTNTKVRRLGYFKILSLFLKVNKKVAATAINKKFENYCLQYQELLSLSLIHI